MRRTRACVPLNPWEHQGTRFRSESPWPRLPHHATRWLHSRSPSLALQLTAVHAVAGAAHMNHDAHMHGSREESLTSLALTSTRRGGPCRQERLKTGSLAPALGTTLRAPHGGDGCPPRYTRASWSEYRRGGGGGGERAGERVTRGVEGRLSVCDWVRKRCASKPWRHGWVCVRRMRTPTHMAARGDQGRWRGRGRVRRPIARTQGWRGWG